MNKKEFKCMKLILPFIGGMQTKCQVLAEHIFFKLCIFMMAKLSHNPPHKGKEKGTKKSV